MPIYCYSTEYGEVHELEFPMGEAPERVELLAGHVIVTRDYQAEGVGGVVIGSDNPVKSRPRRSWPMEPCLASGVHASQAQELRDHLTAHGCPTEVTPAGDPIYTSAAHRKKALKIRGMHDRNSFS